VIEKGDKLELMQNPAFRRFLFSLIQSTGVFDASAKSDDGAHLYREGRRSVTLEILRDMEAAQPVQSPTGIPILTSIQTLREEAQSGGKEIKRARSGTYRDLGDDDQ
jgi:hypothetical protein